MASGPAAGNARGSARTLPRPFSRLARVEPGFPLRIPAAVLLACALVAGCGSTPEKIEIDESGNPFFGGRVLVPLGHAERLRAVNAGEREEAVGWHHALALELGWTGDEAEQDIALGETVRLEDVELLGPGTVEFEYELETLNFSAVNGMVLEDGVMWDVALGLNLTRLELEAELGGMHESVGADSLGPMFAFQFGWLSPWRLALRGRLGYSAELPLDDHTDQVETRLFELGLFLPLGPWAGLDGGWRWKDYDADSADSDVEIDLDGPFVSLALGPY